MISFSETIDAAHGHFTNQNYDLAIFLYSQVLSLDPSNLEYQVYPILCDIASEDPQKGQALFDYFMIKKEFGLDIALESIEDAIGAYDGSNEQMMKILRDISTQTIESLDAIDYDDFLNIVASRGSFREAYEDIMFSTKVAIKTKGDLLEFIEMLIDNDFDTTAYSYLDNFRKLFAYDPEVTKLYEKLEEKSLEDSQK